MLLGEIVDRAMHYTDRIILEMPTYREAAIGGLRRLGHSLAQKSPDHPAIRKLFDYLDALSASAC
ncbi:MAG TPA: hypothetical protein VN715_03960 [Roseiarcus sp.]|nr:hypothetical protein [Roseiarcus sp.]